MRKKGVKSRLEKQEQSNQFLGAGQGLVYTQKIVDAFYIPTTKPRSDVGAIFRGARTSAT
jgi:hypothetical protein